MVKCETIEPTPFVTNLRWVCEYIDETHPSIFGTLSLGMFRRVFCTPALYGDTLDGKLCDLTRFVKKDILDTMNQTYACYPKGDYPKRMVRQITSKLFKIANCRVS